MKKETKLTDLVPLKRNPNRGSKRGSDLLITSFEQNGAGRSILIADNNEILAGNHAYETYLQTVDNPSIIVHESDGTALHIIKRTDIPDSKDKKAQGLIIADNKTSDHHDYDPSVLADYDADIVGEYWFSNELAALEERPDPLDYDEHWRGMPEFSSENKEGFHSLIVHFETEQDMVAFAALLAQGITKKTKYIYYPKQQKEVMLKKGYVDES